MIVSLAAVGMIRQHAGARPASRFFFTDHFTDPEAV
jgi:hypothetical protein